jgi:hypothetical protein
VKFIAVILLSVVVVQDHGAGDALVLDGRLSQFDEGFEFRSCDKTDIYLIEAPYPVLARLDQFIQSQPAGSSVSAYVRFHGRIVEGVDDLPDRYTNVVEILDLLAVSAIVPVKCQ